MIARIIGRNRRHVASVAMAAALGLALVGGTAAGERVAPDRSTWMHHGPSFRMKPGTVVCLSGKIDPSFLHDPVTAREVGAGLTGVVQRGLYDLRKKAAPTVQFERFIAGADRSWRRCQQVDVLWIDLSFERRPDGSPYTVRYVVTQGRGRGHGIYMRDLQARIDAGQSLMKTQEDFAGSISADLGNFIELLYSKVGG